MRKLIECEETLWDKVKEQAVKEKMKLYGWVVRALENELQRTTEYYAKYLGDIVGKPNGGEK